MEVGMERFDWRSTRLALAVAVALIAGLTAYGCGGGSSSHGGFAGSAPGSFDNATFDNATFQ